MASTEQTASFEQGWFTPVTYDSFRFVDGAVVMPADQIIETGDDRWIRFALHGMLDAHEVLLGESFPDYDDDHPDGIGPSGYTRSALLRQIIFTARLTHVDRVRLDREAWLDWFFPDAAMDDAIAVGERLKLWTHDPSTDELRLIGKARLLAGLQDDQANDEEVA